MNRYIENLIRLASYYRQDFQSAEDYLFQMIKKV